MSTIIDGNYYHEEVITDIASLIGNNSSVGSGVGGVGGGIVLAFGKYRGRTLQEVFKRDPCYLLWLKEQDDLLHDIKVAIDGLFTTPADFVMWVGKHKNKTFKYIVEHDEQYAKWLLRDSGGKGLFRQNPFIDYRYVQSYISHVLYP